MTLTISKEAKDFLIAIQSRGWRCSLDMMERAVATLGNPHRNFKSIHVAGTNGKGSVCAMVSSILQSTGLKVGLFISPHLIDLKERITINGKEIDDETLDKLVLKVKETLEERSDPPIQLTYFEFLTVVGFLYFSDEEIDLLVAEVGLGGRFDATNVLPANVSVITQIGLDHMDQLGDTVGRIAAEKAGIIKKGCGVVSAAKDPIAIEVVRKRAFELNCSLIEASKDFNFDNVFADLSGTIFDYTGTRNLKKIRTNLLGKHQAENASTAIAACDVIAHQECFEIRDEFIIKGLQDVYWPGRLEIVSRKPLMVLDCAHNPSAVKRSIESLSELKINPDTIVYSSSRDKDYKSVASILFPRAKRLVLTRYGSMRSVDPGQLASLPEAKDKKIFIMSKVSDAIEKSKEITPEKETILVIGSVFLVGDALSWLKFGAEGDFSLAGFRPSDTPKS